MNFGLHLCKLPSQGGVTTTLQESTAWTSPGLVGWCVSERGNQNQCMPTCLGTDQACLAGATDKAKIAARTLQMMSANLQGMKGNYLCIATARLRQHCNTAGVCCPLSVGQSCLHLHPSQMSRASCVTNLSLSPKLQETAARNHFFTETRTGRVKPGCLKHRHDSCPMLLKEQGSTGLYQDHRKHPRKGKRVIAHVLFSLLSYH